jgi:glycosyltransferase involved in cell wall biosynthesis
MRVASDTAVVVTTHDGARFIGRQIESILEQELLPSTVTVVDDASRDGTPRLVRDIAANSPVPIDLITIDGSRHGNPKTRVAASVMRGLESVSRFPFVLLSDHDDEWLPSRLELQREVLTGRPEALLVAADGVLIDERGALTGGRLRDSFPVPPDWDRLDAAERVRAAVRRPFVTGATCALRRELIPLVTPVPPGWLFDRWATLVAASQDGLVLQPEPLIRYRIHGGQVTGIGQAATGSGGRRWRQVLARGATPFEAAIRARDVVTRIGPMAAAGSIRAELSWRAILRAAISRAEP